MQFLPYPLPGPPNAIARHLRETIHFAVRGERFTCSGRWNTKDLLIELRVSGTGSKPIVSRYHSRGAGLWGLRHYYDKRDGVDFITFWTANQYLNVWLLKGHRLIECEGVDEADPARLTLGEAWVATGGKWVSGVSREHWRDPYLLKYQFDLKHRRFNLVSTRKLAKWPPGYH